MFYNLSNDELCVRACKTGASLVSIKRHDQEYLKSSFDILEGWTFNLFPIISRLNQGEYTYQGNTYKMARNGFLHNIVFDKVIHKKGCLSFELKYNDYTLKMYPFKFLLQVVYKLIHNTIQITYKVSNLDNKPIYFSIGAKPGFKVPLSKRLKFRDYHIEFEDIDCITKLELDSSYFLNGKSKIYQLDQDKTLPLKNKLFDNGALILANASKAISLKSDYDTKSIKLSCPDMSYISLWKKPKNISPYLCLEVWAGLPSYNYKIDDIQTKKGIICLGVNQQYTNNWSIEIE